MRNLSLILSFFLLLFLSGTAFGQAQTLTPEAVAYTAEKTDLSKSITVYPNPAVEYINIKLSTLDASTTKIVLYTILGSELQTEKETVNDHEVRIKVKDLATGYYLIAVRDEQLQFKATYKFLKR
jgi:Secretion system C-terminal sorting domain